MGERRGRRGAIDSVCGGCGEGWVCGGWIYGGSGSGRVEGLVGLRFGVWEVGSEGRIGLLL